MSYSFQVRAATKAQAKQKVEDEFVKVVGHQVYHECDKAQAMAAANAFIDLVDEDSTKDVAVNMSGSLCGRWEGSDVVAIESANVGVTAYLVAREPDKAE